MSFDYGKNDGIIVSGGAGFIGSNLAHKLIKTTSYKVYVIDNLCLGKIKNLISSERIEFIKLDLSNKNKTENVINEIYKKSIIKEVWHMAANSDIPAGVLNTEVDFQNTFLSTYNLFSSLETKELEKIHFASSSAIYGDHGTTKIMESTAPLFPISNYGSFKLASEAILSSFVEKNNAKLYIYRFPNVVGSPATHGVIYDFINRLLLNPSKLKVFGNGKQKKQYLHVDDLISAMLLISLKSFQKRNVFNIGSLDSGIEVCEIAKLIVEKFFNGAEIEYGKEKQGWIGDIPRFQYSLEKLLNLGWKPKFPTSRIAVQKAIDSIGKELI